jgi:hypothetical protein
VIFGTKSSSISLSRQHHRQRRCHGNGCIDLARLRKRGRDTRQNCRYELPEANLSDSSRAQASNVKSATAKPLKAADASQRH